MTPPRTQVNLRRYARSFRHAIEGILDVYRSQRHMRIHFVFIGLNAVAALVYKLSAVETAIVMVVTAMVIFAEMVNTVIEAMMNLVVETYHPIARFAKDVAAGAVLVAALNAAVVGLCIYGNPDRLHRLHQVWVTGDYVDDSAMLRAFAMSIVLLLVVVTAMKVGRPVGSTLQGGAVSGHTALAFCLATCLYFFIRDTLYAPLAVLISFTTATLAAYPKLHDHRRRLRTVFYGAAVGILVPLVVFLLFARPS